MTIPPRTLSLKGCRTRAEAIARYEAWMHEIVLDQGRQNETNRLLAVEAGHLDIDASDAAHEVEAGYQSTAIEEAVKHFREFLEREFPDKP